MSFEDEFKIAFDKTEETHRNISHALGLSVLKKFIERWEHNKNKSRFQQESFGQLIRLTLNEMKVNGKANRQMYSALIGHYYSAHAAYVKARQKESGQIKQKPQLAKAPFGVICGNNGQLSWQL